jgi:hypothetical protein
MTCLQAVVMAVAVLCAVTRHALCHCAPPHGCAAHKRAVPGSSATVYASSRIWLRINVKHRAY